MAAATPNPDPVRALLPRGSGHQFVFCGDACSGVPGAAHEATFASINAVVRRLSPAPDFIIFAGDEIVGLTADADELRGQWGYWLDHEMAWVDRSTTRVWHTTSNHTVYDAASEQVFREVLALPKNGPPRQQGLSYWVRERGLLMVFVNTVWSGLGGEGHVETDWLRQVLADQADARYKLVIGHHPVFPINGFSGPYQREIGPEYTDIFWSILVEASVSAYLCSHILAFDVQVRRGVLQVCSAGVGTAHRMPEGIEYLHCVQAALDEQSFRYQVLDAEGLVRERLEWPLPELSQNGWVLPAARHFRGFIHGQNRPGLSSIAPVLRRGRAAFRGWRANPLRSILPRSACILLDRLSRAGPKADWHRSTSARSESVILARPCYGSREALRDHSGCAHGHGAWRYLVSACRR
jgi:Calcineurin-like phosphoesterase